MPSIYLGPPFSNFRVFREFPRAGEGAWAVARLSPANGQMVLQLGAQPPKNGRDPLFAGAGFEGDISITVAGTYTFSVVAEVGPVSMLPRGDNTIATSVDMGVERVGGDTRAFYPGLTGVIGARYGIVNLAFTERFERGTYVFTVAVGALLDYRGTPSPAPYAEMIATIRSAVEIVPATEAKSEAANETGFRKRAGPTGRVVRELTDAEMARAGVIEFP